MSRQGEAIAQTVQIPTVRGKHTSPNLRSPKCGAPGNNSAAEESAFNEKKGQG
jgi:hypothetical protein